MEVLEKHAMKVRFVPLDVLDGAGGENTVEANCGTVEASDEGSVLAEIRVGWPEGVGLEANEAVEAPEGEGDTVGENELEIALGLEGGDLAGEMAIPVGLLLDFGDDGICGEDAVASCVGRG